MRYSETDSFLIELVEVLVVDAEALEFFDLGGLDIIDLVSFLLNLGSDLLTFLKVVKSLLFGNIFILADLLSNLYGVNFEGIFLGFLNFLLLGFNLFLLLNLGHVILSLNLSLSGKTGLLFSKLSLSCYLEVGLNSLSFELLESFPLSSLSLSFLEGSLGSEGVNFSLSVGCFLL